MAIVDKLLTLFYIVPIHKEFEHIEDVPNYVSDAIPFFLAFVLIEWLCSLVCRRTIYSYKDVVMSLSLGIDQQMFLIWMKSLRFIPYVFVYEYFAPYRNQLFQFIPLSVSLPATSVVARFVIGLLGCDLVYYTFHRVAHEYHIIWTGHGVHHSGERYNLATSLRQGVLQSVFSWMFYLPLAVIGIPPVDFVRHDRLNTVYQFWIHTELIGRLPLLLEMVLNTPSHHRMHHRPPGNCNYAGVLIIWDRLFCSFVPEYSPLKVGTVLRRVHYGLAKPFDSFNPLFANVAHMYKIYESQKSVVQKKNTVFGEIIAMWKTFGFVFKRRVTDPWRIATSFHELFPELSSQMSPLEFISLSNLLSFPRISDDNVENFPDTDADVIFVKQRSVREGQALTSSRIVFATIQVVATLGCSLALLLSSSHMMVNNKMHLLAGCCLILLSLQFTSMFYQRLKSD